MEESEDGVQEMRRICSLTVYRVTIMVLAVLLYTCVPHGGGVPFVTDYWAFSWCLVGCCKQTSLFWTLDFVLSHYMPGSILGLDSFPRKQINLSCGNHNATACRRGTRMNSTSTVFLKNGRLGATIHCRTRGARRQRTGASAIH